MTTYSVYVVYLQDFCSHKKGDRCKISKSYEDKKLAEYVAYEESIDEPAPDWREYWKYEVVEETTNESI